MKRVLFLCSMAISMLAFSQNRSSLNPALAPFYHGVASGDPTATSVIIWTRVTTSIPKAMVLWRVATDTAMKNIIKQGQVLTDATRDFTVKADVTGLLSDKFYYYEFQFMNKMSLRGRTKTAPAAGTANVRFAVVSCANYAEGYFNAYKAVADRNDIDAVIHLGDYIYEYGNGEYGTLFNLQPPTETLVLSDYRTRYNYYKLDSNLIRLHQQYPFFNIWDDHESADNAWTNGAANHTEGLEGTWVNRKAASIQAFREWLPTRDASPTSGDIYRSVRYGNLGELFFLDARLKDRDKQYTVNLPAFLQNPNRKIVGPTQLGWLSTLLNNSTSQWKLIGNQVMVAPLHLLGLPINMDQWDGYAGERSRLYNIIRKKSNVVVLSADLHCSIGNELPDKGYIAGTDSTFCGNAAGVEFVTTSVTARSKDYLNGVAQPALYAANPHIKYAELAHHGYGIVDLSVSKAQYEWYFVSTITSPTFTTSYAKSYFVNANSKCLNETTVATVAAAAKKGLLAPRLPRRNAASANREVDMTTAAQLVKTEMMYGLSHYWYPNPTQANCKLEINTSKSSTGTLQVYDGTGRVAMTRQLIIVPGSNNYIIETNNLPKGLYVYSILINDEKISLQGSFMKL